MYKRGLKFNLAKLLMVKLKNKQSNKTKIKGEGEREI